MCLPNAAVCVCVGGLMQAKKLGLKISTKGIF